jgi:3-deoxy-D-manno-octulosonate 8-phosphate phosphatase (KDO 8-P phosphatase)
MENFKIKLNKIKAFVFDIDGVLTDGSVTIMPSGEQVRVLNIKDCYALQLAAKKGFKIAIISGGKSELVKQRLLGLGVTEVYLGSHIKLESYNEFKEIYTIADDEVLYMGDDIPDYEVMKRVGVPTCPYDSAQEIKDICIYVSPKNGGKGAVRDVVEQVLKVKGKWMDEDAMAW